MNILFKLFLILFFYGCSTARVDNSIIKTSSPVFIENSNIGNNLFININSDNNLTQIVADKLSSKFNIIKDNKNFDIKVIGHLNYFRRNIIKDPNAYIGFGFGFINRGFGFGVSRNFYDDFYPSSTNSYIYDGQVSLQISVKNGKKNDIYETNLDYESGKNLNSLNKALDNFAQKIADYLIVILKKEK